MKNKFLLFLLATVAGVGTINAQQVIDGIYYYLDMDSQTAGVEGADMTELSTGDIVIPASVVYDNITYSVDYIEQYAFSNYTNINSVIIGNSVTIIGQGAFSGCSSLTSVEIPQSVTRIDYAAFSGCTGLTSVNIFDIAAWCKISFNGSESNPLNNAHNLYIYGELATDVVIPNNVTIIRENSFYGCTSLTSIDISNNITDIETRAFEGCTNLATVNIPYGVRDIGYHAFGGCSSLTSISIPSSVISMDGSFSECNSLTSVSINAAWLVASENVSLRGEFGEQVQEYILGDSITFINGRAFEGCKHYSLKIGKNVSQIDEVYMGYMHHSENLSNIEIAEGNTTFDSRNNCNAIIKTATNTLMFGCKGTIIPYGVTTIGEYAFSSTDINAIIIPESVTRIDDGVFSNSHIKHISIPINMMTILGGAFYDSYIDSITWNAKHATISGDYYRPLRNSGLSTLIVGENVEYLPDFFFDCNDLKSVVWRAKKFNGFEGNDDIEQLPHSVENITFGDKVEVIPQKLCQWTQIESVVIPNSVKTIKAGAFYCCEYLKTVVLGDGITTLEYVDNGFDNYGTFTASNNITSFTCYATTPPTMKEHIPSNIVYVPAASVNTYKSANYWKGHTILPIGATPVETDDIHITPSENYADIVWKAIANAASYELYIEFMGNTWRFVFDAEGILTSMTNHAPARYDAPQGTQSAGFSYTVMGLASGTTYNVTITAKSANGSTLNTETASFTTTGEPQGIEDVNINDLQSKKIIRDGNVYVLRGDRVFTLQGQEVK